jgi:hypothetical protein
MNQRGTVLLIIPIFFLLFIFFILPMQCDDLTYTLHDHCHKMRDVGITCTPDDNCWYGNHHVPGPYGFVLILFMFGAIGFCLFMTPDYGEAVEILPENYSPRKKRMF